MGDIVINRQFKPFALYEKEIVKNTLGVKTENWNLIGNIDVAVNYSQVTAVQGDILYTQRVYKGLTSYKGFNVDKQYKLKADRNFYIKEFNTITRLTQLELELIA